MRDLAEAVVTCLTHPAAAGRTYFVAAREVVTARTMAEEIAAQMSVWTLPLPLPTALLWPMCLAQEAGVPPDGQAQRPEPPEIRRAARARLGV